MSSFAAPPRTAPFVYQLNQGRNIAAPWYPPTENYTTHEVDDNISPDQTHQIDIQKCPITSVTVFQSNKALVSRQIDVTISKEGEQLIVVDGFTTNLIEDSIKVSGVGNAVFRGVTFKSNVKTIKNDTTKRDQIKQQIDLIDDKIRELDRKYLILTKQHEFIKNYKKSVLKVSTADSNVEKLLDPQTLQLMTNYTLFDNKQSEVNHASLSTTQQEIDNLNKERQSLSEQLSKEKPQEETLFKRVAELSIYAPECTSVSLEFKYKTLKAQWQPLYDMRVDSVSNKYEISYYANISQATDEDWMEANIKLSTADPNLMSKPPVLYPHYLSTQHHYNNRHIAASSSSVRRRDDSYDEEDEEDEMIEDKYKEREVGGGGRGGSLMRKSSIKQVVTTPQEGATSSVFYIPRLATVKSDSSFKGTKVAVAKVSGDCVLSHYTVPKMDPNAYLKLESTNESDYTFLRGPTQLFVDSNFVASTQFPFVVPGEQFEMFIGQDHGVKVEYMLPTTFKESRSGVFVEGTSTKQMERRCHVKNCKKTQIKVTVVDQYPKSTVDKIKTKLLVPEFRPLPNNAPKGQVQIVNNAPLVDSKLVASKIELDDDNILKWTVDVPPGEEFKTYIKYTVSWPSESAINEDTL
ncbi:hypothetical protein AKO1_010673 [Acrasis kona]|uniref:Mucoidy inhibitor A n=1 Tax=Acrasis kona TaxID=1008807 RepID=A0AAW2ZIU4_9EUKA